MKKWITSACLSTLALGCMESPLSTAAPNFDHFHEGPEQGHVVVCKEGTGADFDLVVDGVASSFSLTAGECANVHDVPLIVGQATPPVWVTVNEIVRPGTQLDEIVLDSILQGNAAVSISHTGTTSITVKAFDDVGYVINFHNSFVVELGEGCTPGYWKQRHHQDSWEVYSPADLFSSVFSDAFPGSTLFEVVRLKKGGLNRLGAHAVAALLNASSSGVNYDYSVSEVIQMFIDAYASGDYEATKDLFEASNEAGCRLN